MTLCIVTGYYIIWSTRKIQTQLKNAYIYIVMAHLHLRRRIRIPNSMATLYWAEYFTLHTRIPTPYFCTGQESESQSVPIPVSGNINEQ